MIGVALDPARDLASWRAAVRPLLAADVPPEAIAWRWEGEVGDLFAPATSATPVEPSASPGMVRLPSRFLTMAEQILCHRDPAVPARLYRLAWRLAHEPGLLQWMVDPDIVWANERAKAIRRDVHKVHAFVRFRRLGERGGAAEGREAFAAWFEPDHLILRLAAPFFMRRFAGMDWAIITPDARALWDGTVLRFGPGGRRDEVPDADVMEDAWRNYYAAIFNPARVKVAAMQAEMPRKYWRNLPEAELIPALIAGAAERVARTASANGDAAHPRSAKWRKRPVPLPDGEE